MHDGGWTCTIDHLGHQEGIEFLGYVAEGAKSLIAKVYFHSKNL